MTRRFLLASGVAAWLLSLGVASAQEKTVLRFVEFRDGSILRLPIVNEPWRFSVLLPSGKIADAALLPSHVNDLVLTSEQDFAKKRQLLSHLLKLGSDDYHEREAAWARLAKFGPSIYPDLQACVALTTDTEIQVRLRALLKKFQPTAPTTGQGRVPFDRIDVKGPSWGYLEDTPIGAIINDKAYSFSRKHIARVSSVAPTNRLNLRRLTEKDLPPGCTEEGFETNPLTGQPLRQGDNVEKLFVGKGFVLSTPVKDSFVAATTFLVNGKSRGLSVANFQPPREGEVVIRFCHPGKEHIAATVDYFGCYLGDVMADGTVLVAYDLQDRELGKVSTQHNGDEFVAIHSDIPVHKIRIVPNVKVDVNFSLDDFVYHFATTAQAAHPDKVLVDLLAGDSILCKDVVFGKDEVELQGLPAGLPNLTLPVATLARVNPPQTPKRQPQEGLFAELADGSILFAAEPADPRQQPKFTRYPLLLADKSIAGKDLVGVWTTRSGRKVHAPKPGQLAVFDRETQQWQDAKFVRFLEEVAIWQGHDGQSGSAGYEQFTTLWLAPPRSTPEAGRWHVQTIEGEDLVLSRGQPITGRLTDSVRCQWRDQELTLPAAQIMSIYHVPGK